MNKNEWYDAGDKIGRLVQDAVDSMDFSRLGDTIADVVNQTVDDVQWSIRRNLGNAGQRRYRSGEWQEYGQSDSYQRSGTGQGGYQSGGAGQGGYQSGGAGQGGYQSGSAGQGGYQSGGAGQGGYQSGGAGQGGCQSGGAGQGGYQSGGAGQGGYRSGGTGAGSYQSGSAGQSSYQSGGAGQRSYQRTNGSAAEQIRREIEERMRGQASRSVNWNQKRQTALVVPGEMSGRVMKWVGYGLGGMFGLASLFVSGFVIAAGAVPGAVASLLFWLGLCGASVGVGKRGSGKLKLANRFRRYMSILGDRTFCKIEELASGAGYEGAFVRKDLKKMIRKGFFREGYLDRLETVLITDKKTYEQYLVTQEEYDRRTASEGFRTGDTRAGETGKGSEGQADGIWQRAEQQTDGTERKKAGKAAGGTAQKADGLGGSGTEQRADGTGQRAEQQTDGTERKKKAGKAAWGTAQKTDGRGGPGAEQADTAAKISAEVRELIAEGNRYIQYVHECNDRLPGEEISAKLDRLELVITRIFRETEKNPAIAGDLKKMMSYYLPTMKKLLDVYCELEEQPISGQNIAGTKKEIEDAIDTINMAFENLLDSFFEETAWDVSSDISVLNTMFAQQGLKGRDFV